MISDIHLRDLKRREKPKKTETPKTDCTKRVAGASKHIMVPLKYAVELPQTTTDYHKELQGKKTRRYYTRKVERGDVAKNSLSDPSGRLCYAGHI